MPESSYSFLNTEPESPIKSETNEPWRVLVIDDDAYVHELTALVLKDFVFEGRGLVLLHGYSGEEAKKLVRENKNIAVILLDVVMETTQAGLEAAEYIRKELGNDTVQLLVRTGQAGEFSEDDAFEKYEINFFLEKADLTSRRLLTALKTALRTYRVLDEAKKGKR